VNDDRSPLTFDIAGDAVDRRWKRRRGVDDKEIARDQEASDVPEANVLRALSGRDEEAHVIAGQATRLRGRRGRELLRDSEARAR
jgi:hypothetical protein